MSTTTVARVKQCGEEILPLNLDALDVEMLEQRLDMNVLVLAGLIDCCPSLVSCTWYTCCPSKTGVA
jgi:hypothetical protein